MHPTSAHIDVIPSDSCQQLDKLQPEGEAGNEIERNTIMLPSILAITAAYFLFEWLLSLGLQNTLFDNSYNLVAMLPAGIVGGFQYAATTGRGLRWGKRLLLALYGNIAIILAPTVVSLFFAVPMLILGLGFRGVMILPTLLSLTTLTAILAFLITFLLAIPTIFVGATIGQWVQYRRLARR